VLRSEANPEAADESRKDPRSSLSSPADSPKSVDRFEATIPA
jgi:hypothetical protein